MLEHNLDDGSELGCRTDDQAVPPGVLLYPSQGEAEERARELDLEADRYDAHLSDVAADLRAAADRLRNPGAYLAAGTRLLRGEDGVQVVGEDGHLHRMEPVEKTRARMELVAEWERFSRLSEPEQRAYEALGRRVRHGTRPAIVRRTPAARPAARRPRARRGTSSRAGPSADSDGSEPAAGRRRCDDPRRLGR